MNFKSIQGKSQALPKKPLKNCPKFINSFTIKIVNKNQNKHRKVLTTSSPGLNLLELHFWPVF